MAGFLHRVCIQFVALLFGVCATLGLQAACLDNLQGELIQGGLIWGTVAPGSRVTLDGESLDVMANGTTVAGFGRDAAESAMLVVAGAQPCEESLTIAARDYKIQRVEGVPQQTVTPSPEYLERIGRERSLVANAKRQRLSRPDLL